MSGSGRILLTVTIAILTTASLASCSLVPDLWPGASSPTSINGVRLAESQIDLEDITPALKTTVVDQSQLGLMPLRIRHDASKISARFAYIPGAASFNAWINDKIWREVRSTHVAYSPQTQPSGSGFSDRGCISGSTTWSARDILTKPSTGPLSGTGTAIVCDITATYGHQIEMKVRTVAGSPETVTRDETDTRIVNTQTGDMFDPTQHWSEADMSTLWLSAVTLLSRKAGGSGSETSDKATQEQLQLIRQGLEQARRTIHGELYVPIPAGLRSGVLADRNISQTNVVTEVIVEPLTVRSWTSPSVQSHLDDLGTPVKLLTKPLSEAGIDCALVPCVALTYDDGPTPYSPTLLETLRAQRASATFFHIGLQVTRFPDLVKKVAADGHEIGSHTYHHKELTKLPLAEAKFEVTSVAETITKLTGKPVTLYRAPYGSVNPAIVAAIGMPALNWNVDPEDWTTPGRAALLERTLPLAKADSIILFHEIRQDSVIVADALIRGLRDRGLEPVTISQLFGGSIPNENIREVRRGSR